MSFVNFPGYIQALVLVTVSLALLRMAFARVRLPQRRHRRWLPLAAGFHGLGTLLVLVILWNPSCRKMDESIIRNQVLAVFDTSQSMSVADRGQATRLDRALQVFAETCDPETGPLYQVLGFDEITYRCASPAQLERWGTDTQAQPVYKLLKQHLKPEGADDATDHPVVGVILFTDGQWQGKSLPQTPITVPEELEFLCIGVGTQAPLADVGIDSLQVPAAVPVNTLYQAQVVVSTCAWGTPVTVELLQDNEIVGTQSLPAMDPSVSRMSHTLSFTLPAHIPGQGSLLARIRPADHELNQANNQYAAVVDVVGQEQRYSVLYYAQGAGFSLGKIRQALARDKKVELDVRFDFVTQPRPGQTAGPGGASFPLQRQQFFAYDLILLGPCDFDGFAPEQQQALYDFVALRGGGLIILTESGPLAFDTWANPQARVLLPVTDMAVVDDAYGFTRGLLEPDPGAVEAQIFQTGDFAAQDLPLSLTRHALRVKPGATVLARIGQSPALVCQRVGRGRVCLLNMTQLHRLWQADKEDNALGKLLSAVTAHAGRHAAGQAQLELYAQRTDDGRALVFNARVTDEQFRPLGQANVLLTLGKRTVALHPIGEGVYSGQMPDMKQDSLLATLQAESQGRFLGERRVAVNLAPVPTEMTNVQLDEVFLRQLARKYEGQYLHVDKVPSDLGRRFSREQRSRETLAVIAWWPSWFLFILLCLLLSTSWFIRRSAGLL